MADANGCFLLAGSYLWSWLAYLFGERNGKLREVIGGAVLTLKFVLLRLSLGFRCVFAVPLGAVAACVDLEDSRIQVFASVFVG